MGIENEDQSLLNNNNNTSVCYNSYSNGFNIVNCSYSYLTKIKLKKEENPNSMREVFCNNFPPELYHYISTQDYCSIIQQLNHYKQNRPYSPYYNGIALFFYILFFFFLILFRNTNVIASICIVPIMLIFTITHIVIITSIGNKFYREVMAYIEFLNSIYTNITFEGHFLKKSLRDVEITIGVLDEAGKVLPPNKYSHSILCGFKYLVPERLQFISYSYNNTPNVIALSSNSSVAIDFNNYQFQYQYQQPFQPNQQPLQPIIINSNKKSENKPINEYKQPTIEELLTPSATEDFYRTQNNQ
ncbi:hypothetical protein DICPUDRAFT_146586 [Dictyostelium purpureum]|uniref:Transmembrane protein n=1 Tax=Dictyostelium purpureum TaxID=5786 RepID=F0Z6C5_DICPU|nr:uncharacterized protein DICPUDRAFT_146586 [Dictyostelium purpureum]EGC40417.1 hypothetical protein DICPUDRAFT_146586 [Dictyostelium purpureum]|eukprot:XP_003282964.1 hypothetical protein DICPUDRAFT_146586 [Dictyostelium purpureum]